MKVIYETDLISKYKNKSIFLDTNALILAVSSVDFLKLLYELKENGCDLLSIPSVYYEFTSNAETLEKYNLRAGLFLKMGIGIYPIERRMKEFKEFIFVLRKQANMDYADSLLCCCLYGFKSAYVLTENHKHFPTQILDRKDIITIDSGKDQIRNIAMYIFSSDKFEKAAKSILEK